jgi:hypothetical protein
MLYLCRDDFWLKENFVRGDLPSRQSLQKLLEDLFLNQPVAKLPDGSEVIKLNQVLLGREHDIRPNPLGIILATIELRFGLIRAITPEYSVYQFEAKPAYSTIASRDNSPEAKAVLDSATKARKWYTVDVNAAAAKYGLLRADVIRKLNEFNDRGFLQLKASGVVNRYKVLKELPTTSKQIGAITDKLHAEMEDRERDAMKRFQAVCDLLTGSRCFAGALTEYFGMELPERKSKCGHCTYCLTGKPVVLPPKPPPSINMSGILDILAACTVRDDPRFLARIAFGIKSPRVTQLKLDKKDVFGSLEDHDFKVCLLNPFYYRVESF